MCKRSKISRCSYCTFLYLKLISFVHSEYFPGRRKCKKEKYTSGTHGIQFLFKALTYCCNVSDVTPLCPFARTLIRNAINILALSRVNGCPTPVKICYYPFYKFIIKLRGEWNKNRYLPNVT